MNNNYTHRVICIGLTLLFTLLNLVCKNTHANGSDSAKAIALQSFFLFKLYLPKAYKEFVITEAGNYSQEKETLNHLQIFN